MTKICLMIFCTLFTSQQALAVEAAGLFMSAKGDVKVTRNGQADAAKVGMKFYIGDVVTTGTDSRAKITLKDRTNIFVSPNSTFTLDKFETGKVKNVELNLKEGKIRNEVNTKYEGKNQFLIKTPTAVAGVRGTDFVTSFDVPTQVTEVVTLKGSVALDAFGAGKVTIDAGQTSSVKASQAPLPPQPVAPEKLNEVQKDFSVSSSPQTDKQASTNNNQATENTDRSPASAGDSKDSGRMVDRQDQSPDTFDRNTTGGDKSQAGNVPAAPKQGAIPGFRGQPGATTTAPDPASLPQSKTPSAAPVKIITNPPDAVGTTRPN